MSIKFLSMSNLLERLLNGTTQEETTRSPESSRSSEIKDAIDDGEAERDDEKADGDVEKVVKKKKIKKRL